MNSFHGLDQNSNNDEAWTMQEVVGSVGNLSQLQPNTTLMVMSHEIDPSQLTGILFIETEKVQESTI